MLYLKETLQGEGGKKTERYVTDPLQVDRVAREAWNPIYAGNVTDTIEHCKNFMAKYAAFIYDPPVRTEVRDIDPEQLFQLFAHTKHNSGGLDGWTPADLTLMSRVACTLVCQMLNQIEMGTMQWPKPVLTARAAFMAKDPNQLEDPLKYRVLTVLPVVYRKWASQRLKDMNGWMEDWEIEELFTIKGGAQAAWWTTALSFEALHSKEVTVTGGSADLQKAFDEIKRELLDTLLRKGWLPRKSAKSLYNCLGKPLGV